jgi:hypothetical protein
MIVAAAKGRARGGRATLVARAHGDIKRRIMGNKFHPASRSWSRTWRPNSA